MPTPKPKPCPFCGHSAEVCTMWFLEDDPEERKNLRVVCTFCGAIGPETWDGGLPVEGEEALVELWNRRAPAAVTTAVPCPSCGAQPIVMQCVGEVWVLCELCGTSGNMRARMEDAIADWNMAAGASPVMQGPEQEGGQP